MIVSFSVANFRSFSSEETFSLVASNRLDSNDHINHVFDIPDANNRILKTSVIYGANGAGKSNLFKAVRYLKTIATQPRKKNTGTGREPFCFLAEQSSDFDLLLIANHKLYRYGIKVNNQRVLEEWLLEIIGDQENIIFERNTDENGVVKIEGLEHGDEKLKALVTIGGLQNQSFLASVIATLEPHDFGILENVINWFEKSLILIAPNAPCSSLGHLLENNSDFLEFASEFLKNSSTGINKLNVHKVEITENELHNLLPDDIFSEILDDFDRQNDKDGIVIEIGQEKELRIERSDEKHYFRVEIQSEHLSSNGEKIDLELDVESDGTKRLLHLLPALHYLKKSDDVVFFIDEIDRSMHPILSKGFLKFFLESSGDRHQMIVTSHESNLLDLDLLRRDEIWFSEKDSTGSTRLYSLIDHEIRNDVDLRSDYLQGRFGAIPFLRGNLRNYLMESK